MTEPANGKANGTTTYVGFDGEHFGAALPSGEGFLEQWLGDIVSVVKSDQSPFDPCIQDFQNLIESDTTLFMQAKAMFKQVPQYEPYCHNPLGRPQIRDYKQLLQFMNAVMGTAPKWNSGVYKLGWLCIPINVVLDRPISAPSGKAFFLNAQVNEHVKKILNIWAEYLGSEASAVVLSDDEGGWFSQDALTALGKVTNAGKGVDDFEDLFVCDQSLPHWGFQSWDDFFTRQFRPGVRPIAKPEDDNMIVNACESKPYRLAKNVARRDTFWVKEQPYSVLDMLAHDELADQFVGGTVYQAFLSSMSYHRWHSPVSGTVLKIHKVPGTYYSMAESQSFGARDISLSFSQGYLTGVATRSLIYIEADSPDIGLMCVMPVGMAEVSTCETNVEVGQHVQKGDELGTFHYGGSTYCLIFRPQTVLEWSPVAALETPPSGNINVNSETARAKAKE
jgi:phosphatidylserine decarboxylase